MALYEARPSNGTVREPEDDEKRPLLQSKRTKSTTYRQCCCCSLGTAVTVWAVFLLALSTYFLFDPNVSGAAYTAGGIVGLVTASLLLSAIGKRNAFPAFVAVYTQIALNVIWVLQLGLTCYMYWRVLQGNNPHKPVYTIATAGWRQGTDSGRPLTARLLILDLPLSIVLCARIVLLGLLLLFSHFTFRVLWSFYRVLQSGGTTFEFKTAEDIEDEALQAHLPTILTATPTPRHWDPLAQGPPRPGESPAPW